jgi:hypothetical protein
MGSGVQQQLPQPVGQVYLGEEHASRASYFLNAFPSFGDGVVVWLCFGSEGPEILH